MNTNYFRQSTPEEQIQAKIERAAKTLYEQEFSSGYWDTFMTKGDKSKWINKAKQVLLGHGLAIIEYYYHKDPDEDTGVRRQRIIPLEEVE